MKALKLLTALTFLAATVPPAIAAEPQTAAPKHDHSMAMPGHDTDMATMMERAQKAKTPAEKSKLMAENMAMMKAHMAEMKGMSAMGGMMDGKMMDGKPMPITMDPAHMEKMHKHMAMMHEMMERLIIQQDLMMKPAPK
jgi:hypothetical protein